MRQIKCVYVFEINCLHLHKGLFVLKEKEMKNDSSALTSLGLWCVQCHVVLQSIAKCCKMIYKYSSSSSRSSSQTEVNFGKVEAVCNFGLMGSYTVTKYWDIISYFFLKYVFCVFCEFTVFSNKPPLAWRERLCGLVN